MTGSQLQGKEKSFIEDGQLQVERSHVEGWSAPGRGGRLVTFSREEPLGRLVSFSREEPRGRLVSFSREETLGRLVSSR